MFYTLANKKDYWTDKINGLIALAPIITMKKSKAYLIKKV